MAKSEKSTSNRSSDSQTIEELRQRYDELNQRKIVFQTKRDTALEQLDQLKKSALEQYGTDDVKELQKKLEAMKKENELQRSKYQDSLDQIESSLSEIEEEFEPAHE